MSKEVSNRTVPVLALSPALTVSVTLIFVVAFAAVAPAAFAAATKSASILTEPGLPLKEPILLNLSARNFPDANETLSVSSLLLEIAVLTSATEASVVKIYFMESVDESLLRVASERFVADPSAVALSTPVAVLATVLRSPRLAAATLVSFTVKFTALETTVSFVPSIAALIVERSSSTLNVNLLRVRPAAIIFLALATEMAFSLLIVPPKSPSVKFARFLARMS